MTLVDLAREVGLSSPSVTERLRRLEGAGVITGFTAIVDPARLGYGLLAFIRLAAINPIGNATRLEEVLTRPEVMEAHHVVGEDCWIFKVAVRNTAHLEQLLLVMAQVGTTTTSIVLSSPVLHRALPVSDEIEEGPGPDRRLV
jgi:Lrp/AsnC family leucine-responsive transcriptional regulator